MPPKAIKTVRDLIYWQYAKLIAKSAGFYDGDKKQFGFVMDRFKKLKNDEINWSGILREDEKMTDLGKRCMYCGSEDEICVDHIIPQKINPPGKCKHLFEIHNIVFACKKCNSSKGDKDLYEWYGIERRNVIPRIAEGKYLKLVYICHECRGTLDMEDLNKDRQTNVYDLGYIFRTPCPQENL